MNDWYIPVLVGFFGWLALLGYLILWREYFEMTELEVMQFKRNKRGMTAYGGFCAKRRMKQ